MQLIVVMGFILGTIFGSFYNVCIYRIPLGISVAKGNSFCPSCHERIRWYDLVPVLSFLFLRGKCRHCANPISPRYTVVELLTGVLFALCVLCYGVSVTCVLTLILLSCLVILSFIDIENKLIPDRFPIIIAVVGALNAAYNVYHNDESILEYVIGIFAVSLPFLLIAVLTGGMGGGDIKLVAAAGLFLGWKNILLAVTFGAVIGAVVSIVLLILKKAGKKSEIPFGPFLSVGITIAALHGNEILNWYSCLIMN